MTQNTEEAASCWRELGSKGVTVSFTSPRAGSKENETRVERQSLHKPWYERVTFYTPQASWFSLAVPTKAIYIQLTVSWRFHALFLSSPPPSLPKQQGTICDSGISRSYTLDSGFHGVGWRRGFYVLRTTSTFPFFSSTLLPHPSFISTC